MTTSLLLSILAEACLSSVLGEAGIDTRQHLSSVTSKGI
jgi:hypothetical protein